MKTLNIEARIDKLDKVLDFIDDELNRSGCRMKTALQIKLAVEELFVNIASYGYTTKPGDVSISINISEDPRMVEITITDSGIPYNPLTRDDPDVGLSAEERKIGGLGVFLVKKAMDHMSYEYKEGHNIVKIAKKY